MAGFSKAEFAAAATAAATADATIIVIGLDQTQEREGHDRYSIALPGVQDDFVASVAMSAKVLARHIPLLFTVTGPCHCGGHCRRLC